MARIIGTSTSNTTLAYEMFAGEILAEFAKNTTALDLVRTRILPKGAKSVSFPKFGTATAGWHTAGDNIITTDAAGYANTTTSPRGQLLAGETILYADKKLLSSALIDALEEKIVNWDARGVYVEMLGRSLAEKMDQQIYRVIFNGAGVAADAEYTGHPGGVSKNVDVATATLAGLVDVSAYATNIPIYLDALMSVKTSFDNNGVPMNDRFLIVTPSVYNWLLAGALKGIATGLFVNKDVGGDGSVSTGGLGTLAGFKVIASNNLPTASYSSTAHRLVSGEGNTYTADTSLLCGLAFQKEAAGLVKAQDLTMEADYLTEYQATLLVASMAAGAGYLRPEACAKMLVT